MMVDHATFNEAAAEIDAVLREAEEAIRDMRLGTSASVPLDGERLHFGKRAGRWCLYVSLVESANDREDPPVDLDIWSRPLDTRMQAVRELPELLGALRARREGKLDELLDVAERGREWLASLKPREVAIREHDPIVNARKCARCSHIRAHHLEGGKCMEAGCQCPGGWLWQPGETTDEIADAIVKAANSERSRHD